MSKKKIQGITIQLDGDVTPLERALKDVDKASSRTSGEISKINRALKFDPSNTTLLAQKQEVLQESIKNTTTRLDSLKQAQSEVERLFSSGEIDASTYRDFIREIEITSGKLESFKRQANDFEVKISTQVENESLENAKNSLKNLKDASKLLEAEGKKLASSFRLQNAQMSSTASESEKLSASYTQVSTQLNHASKSVQNLEQQLEHTKAVFGENSAEVMELESKLNGAKTTVAKFENELQGISNRQLEIQVNVTTQSENQALENAKQSLDSLKNESKLLEAEGRKLASSFRLQNAEMSSTASETEKLNASYSQISSQIAHASKSVRNLEKQLEQAKTVFGANSSEVMELESKLNGAKTTVANFKNELKSVRDQQVEVQVRISTQSQNEALENAEKSLENLRNESKLLEAEGRKLTSSIKLQNAQMSSTASESEKLTASYSQISSELTHASKSVQNLEQQLAQTKAVFGENSAEVMELESKLNGARTTVANFKNELQRIRDREIELEIEANTSDLRRAEAELEELSATAKQVGKDIGNSISRGAMVGAAGLMALTVGTMDTTKQLTRLESQSNSALSSVDKLGNNIKKLSEAEIQALNDANAEKEDTLSKSLDKQLSVAEKNYDAQEKAFKKSLDNEVDALEKAHAKKLQLIDSEYKERLKLIDEDEYKRLKAIDSQIEALEKEQDAIDKANKLAEEGIKRQELVEKVEGARTNHDKKKAQEELSNYDKKLAEERAKEERKNNIETLKEQKDSISETADKKREAVQSEFELKQEQLQQSFDAEKEKMQELHAVKSEQFNEQKTQYLNKIKEQYAEELELFKKMNAEKVEIASKPVVVKATTQETRKVNLDVSDFKGSRVIFDSVNQDVDQGIEALGNLVRAGYETEADLTKISKNIGGAIQLYGDTFNAESLAESITTTTQLGEVTGQLTDLLEKNGMTVEDFNAQLQQYSTVGERANFISDLLASQGMTEAYETFAKTHPEIVKNSEANIEFTDAISDLTTALIPLVTAITELLTKFADFGAEHPVMAKGFVILSAVVGGLVTVFGVLMPVFGNLMKVIPKLGKFLPWLGRAFGLLSGPIGWVITIVITLIQLVPVIIKNWGKISKFFSKLWDGVVDSFKWAIKGIEKIALGVVNVIKMPINGMIKMLNSFLKDVNKIKIPDWVPAVGGKSFKIPEIPMLARGTDYFKGKNGLAIVGEEGPELVKLPRSASVKTAQETANILGGSGELTINVPLSIDGRVFANAVAKYTNRELYAMQQRDSRGR